ncbi:hypothetical protein EXM22_10830 [Oceanispirochaeta crateris]|uniref:Aminotransferase class III-fold pyridoxal phosphate-dependent enzyme n=1 Tax=Oceanispirochaeta crateris TaxID=2518645 RepID=A0A5C1QK00_9SPIO|nr:hypothetical protein [Oceanispirochaeta crateris]QEN08455.1 hypothetical protein EXM22_10830 [Oceanispirochaeta crateris]
MVIELKEQELLRLMPAIRRARDFHLYDTSGKRYLDLYQEGGRAWLGHRPDGLSLQLKNILSRGVYAPYPGSEEGKLYKALKALLMILPGSSEFSHIRYYSSVLGGGLPEAADPLYSKADRKPGLCTLWRPGLQWPHDAINVEMLIPLPGLAYGRVIASRDDSLPQGDLPSPVVAGGLARCVWVLKNCLETAAPVGELDLLEGAPWKQKGPYCLYTGNADNYKILFSKALSAGILLPPSLDSPCILPGHLTSGDVSLVKQFFGGLS